jgi:hypothetical protein
MDALKSWALTICFAALAAGIAGIIAPSGKIEKVYKFAVSLFFLCCLLVPLFSLKNISLTGIDLNKTSGVSSSELNSVVSEQAAGVARQNISQLVARCCRSCGVEPVKVNVLVSTGTDGAMSVKSAEVVLRAADMAKKAKIATTVMNRLGMSVKIKEGGN